MIIYQMVGYQLDDKPFFLHGGNKSWKLTPNKYPSITLRLLGMSAGVSSCHLFGGRLGV